MKTPLRIRKNTNYRIQRLSSQSALKIIYRKMQIPFRIWTNENSRGQRLSTQSALKIRYGQRQIPLIIWTNGYSRSQRLFNIVHSQNQIWNDANTTYNLEKRTLQRPTATQHSPRSKSIFGQKYKSKLEFGLTQILDIRDY